MEKEGNAGMYVRSCLQKHARTILRTGPNWIKFLNGMGNYVKLKVSLASVLCYEWSLKVELILYCSTTPHLLDPLLASRKD